MLRTFAPPRPRAARAAPALLLLVLGCAAVPAPRLPGTIVLPAPPPLPIPPARAALGARVVASADSLVGVRYRYGGSTPASGFDCSGFAKYVFAKHDVVLPRTSRAMATAGVHVPADFSRLRAGDLVFFGRSRARITHVAIVVGDGRIVHASSTRRQVRYDEVGGARGAWFRRHLVAARRVVPGTAVHLAADGP